MSEPCGFSYTDKNGNKKEFKTKDELIAYLHSGALSEAISNGKIKDESVLKDFNRTSDSKLESMRKNAISKLSSGKIDKDQHSIDVIGRFLSIKPKYIPEEYKEQYNSLVSEISGRDINLKDKATYLQKVNMFSSEVNGKLIEAEERAPSKTKESTIDDKKQSVIDSIDSLNGEDSVVTSKLLDKDSKQNADFILNTLNKGSDVSKGEVFKKNWLESLSEDELRNVEKSLRALDQGRVTEGLRGVRESVEKFKLTEEVIDAVKKSKGLTDLAISARLKAVAVKLLGTKMLGAKELDKIPLSQQASRLQKYTIDSILGNVTSSPIYKKVFGTSAIQFGKHSTYKSSQEARVLNPIENAQSDFYKGDVSEIVKSNIRQTIYTIQRMHLLGGNQKVNRSIFEYAKAVLDRNNMSYGEVTKKAITEALNDFKKIAGEGGENIDSYFESFNDADKKMVSDLDKFYGGDVSQKAASTSFFDEQRALDLKNKDIYRPVSFLNNVKSAEDVYNSISGASDYANPSMKSGNLKEKTGATGDLNKILNFTGQMDIANSYLSDVSMQYHLLGTSRVVLGSLNGMMKDKSLSNQNNEVVRIIHNMYDSSIRNVIDKEYNDFGIFNTIEKGVVISTLAGIPKSGAEFVSNVVNSTTRIKDVADGINIINKLSKQGVNMDDLIYNLGLLQGERILGDGMFSKMKNEGSSDLPFEKRVNQNLNIDAKARNMLIKAYNKAKLNSIENYIEDIHDALLTSPDKAVSKPLNLGIFNNKFTEANNGVAPDFVKIASGDVEYMDKHKDIIENASIDADIAISQIISSKNPFTIAEKYQTNKKDPKIRQNYVKVNSFFRNHQNAQWSGMYMAIKSAMNNGAISKKQATFIFTQKVASQMSYNIVNTFLGSMLFNFVTAPLTGSVQDEDNESIVDKAKKQGVGSIFSILTSASGSVPSAIGSFGASILEEKYGEKVGLREGEYDKSKAAIFSKYNPNKTTAENLVELSIGTTGSLGIVADRGKSVFEDIGNKDFFRAGLNTFALTGKIPIYKDVKSQLQMVRFNSVPNLEEQASIVKSGDVSDVEKMELQKSKFMERLMYTKKLAEYKLHKKDITKEEMTNVNKETINSLKQVFKKDDYSLKLMDRFQKMAVDKIKISKGIVPENVVEFKKKSSVERSLWVANVLKEYENKKVPESILIELNQYSSAGLINMTEKERALMYKDLLK